MHKIDIEKIASSITHHIAKEVAKRQDNNESNPHVAAIQVGHLPELDFYIHTKQAAFYQVGMDFSVYHLPEKTTQEEIVDLIHFINTDSEVSGIILQTPLPAHLNTPLLQQQIAKEKDVEGVQTNLAYHLPAQATVQILKAIGNQLENNHTITLLTHTPYFAEAVSTLLQGYKETAQLQVDVVLVSDKDAQKKTASASVLVVLVNSKESINQTYIKPGAVVIDCGMHFCESGELFGDVNLKEVAEISRYYYSTHDGLAPLYLATLVQNTLHATI